MATVPDVVRSHAADDDGREFLRLIVPGDADRVISYSALRAEAERWTRFYHARGLGPGDRVIVVLPHSLELYTAYIGALLGGQVPAMFAFPSPKFSEAEYFRNVGTLIATAGSRMLVAYPELAEKLERREREALGSAQLVTPASAMAEGAGDSTGTERLEPDPEATAFLQYSSGTTGIKKGVAVSHRALLWQVETYAKAIGAGPEDRIVSWLPLYHDMGLIACLFLPLLMRVPLIAMSPFDWVRSPAMWAAAVTRHRGTLSWLPNFAYSFMATNVGEDDLHGVDLSSLRGVVNCSEPIMAASHDAFLERFSDYGLSAGQLAASYAMAENTFALTSGGFGAPVVVDWIDGPRFDREARAEPVAASKPGARPLVSSGRLLPEHELVVVGADGAPVGAREVGELAFRSPCLMSGYDHNATATEEAMRDGRYHTGDLGYVADGEVFVTGRARDLIIVGGRNIYPQDIERVVEEVEGVLAGRVVAVGVPEARLGTESLAILAETKETDPDRRERLRHAIHAAVSEQTEVVPHVIRVLDHRSLLKSSSGKPARAANRDRFLTSASTLAWATRGRPTSDTSEAPRSGEELAVAVWQLVSEVVENTGEDAGQLDAHTPLLTSGLIDSFGMVELFSGLERILGASIPAELRGQTERFDAIASIVELLVQIQGEGEPGGASEPVPALDPGQIPMRYQAAKARRRTRGFWSFYYWARLRLKGIRAGRGLKVLGPILLQIDGRPGNISIGANVTLMPGAHLKNRENGKIVLHDGVKLDTMARIVAANDARLELGENVALGLGTVVNAGRDVLIGRGSLTAAHCVINVSDHGIAAGTPIQQQPFEHAPIYIGEDVWLGAGVVVSRGSRIGSGAVVSAGSTVSGRIPPMAIVHGSPARPVKYRR